MMEFSGQGRPGRPGRATPMTPEERQGQKERKVAMRKALRELLSDRDTITSRSQRIKLKIASAAVRTTTQIGRKGPAAGSVLDHREHQLRDQHHTQQSMREESIQAVLAAISARIDELEGEEGSPRSVQSAPTEPGMGSPISVPMVRQWSSSKAVLQRGSSASGRLSSSEGGGGGGGGGGGAAASPPVAVAAPFLTSSSRGSSSSMSFHSAKDLDESSERALADLDAFDTPASPVPAKAAPPPEQQPQQPAAAQSPPPTVTPSVEVTGGAERDAAEAAAAAAAAEEEEEVVQALDGTTLQYMSEMVGTWKNIQTNNLEAYLKHMGVGWAKRKIALAFKPEPSFALVDGVLQVLMPSPIGERLERFPLDAEEQDTDPYGKTFYKRTWWEGSVLTQSATYPNGKTAETLTTRQIDADGHLVQRTTNSGVTFERIFQRKQ